MFDEYSQYSKYGGDSTSSNDLQKSDKSYDISQILDQAYKEGGVKNAGIMLNFDYSSMFDNKTNEITKLPPTSVALK